MKILCFDWVWKRQEIVESDDYDSGFIQSVLYKFIRFDLMFCGLKYDTWYYDGLPIYYIDILCARIRFGIMHHWDEVIDPNLD